MSSCKSVICTVSVQFILVSLKSEGQDSYSTFTHKWLRLILGTLIWPLWLQPWCSVSLALILTWTQCWIWSDHLSVSSLFTTFQQTFTWNVSTKRKLTIRAVCWTVKQLMIYKKEVNAATQRMKKINIHKLSEKYFMEHWTLLESESECTVFIWSLNEWLS